MGNKVKFYTKEEKQRVLEVAKTSTNLSKSSVILAKEFGRSVQGVYFKLRTAQGKVGNFSRKTSKKVIDSGIDAKASKPTKVKFQDRTITIPIKQIVIKDNNLIITH